MPEYIVNMFHFPHFFQNHKIRAGNVGSGVSAPLPKCCRNDSVYTGRRTPAQSLISYFSRCSQAWAWDPALYIPARHHVCCMMEGGGCSGPARLILSQGRGGNSRLYCCPGLPAIPRGKHPEGYRRSGGEVHRAIYRAGKEQRWGENERVGEWERRGELKTRWGGTEESESRWQSVMFAADSLRRDPGWRCLQHLLLNWMQPLTRSIGLLVQKLTKYASTYWFMVERVHAEVSLTPLKGSEIEQRE